jgi:hypothetical protein
MSKKISLKNKGSNHWELVTDSRTLVEFSVLDVIEAVRFAENWVSSFSFKIDIEVPDEYSAYQDTEKTGVHKTNH